MPSIEYEAAIRPSCKNSVFANQIVKCEKCNVVGCAGCMNLAADGKGVCNNCFASMNPQDKVYWTAGHAKLKAIKRNTLVMALIALIGMIVAFVGSNMWQNSFGNESESDFTTGMGLAVAGMAVCFCAGCGTIKSGKKFMNNEL